MRSIKFRWKSQNNEWVYKDIKNLGINYNLVIEDTLSEYIGLCDDNKNELYEGDIVTLTIINNTINNNLGNPYSKPYKVTCVIEYSDNNLRFGFKRISKNSKKCSHNRHWFYKGFTVYTIESIKLIGNIYE